MRRLVALVAIGFVLAAGSVANAQVIYDNASTVPGAISPIGMVTNPGAGFGGADASMLLSPDTVFGFGMNNAAVPAVRLADNFIVPAGQTWSITGANVYGYLTGATTPTATGGVLRFWSGTPGAGGTVIAGDATTNVLVAGSNVFTNIYRTLSPDTLATNRRVQQSTLNLGTPLVLTAGTYWVEYGMVGNSFVPPLSVSPATGGVVTGDALQTVDGGTVYNALLDGTAAKGMAFQLTGSVVPEPTSIALVGIGALGLGLRRLRKKK